MQKDQFTEWGEGEGRCRERRYADHIVIQIYFRMHHFVVTFSEFSSPQAAGGALTPLTKILRTPLGPVAASSVNFCSLGRYYLDADVTHC